MDRDPWGDEDTRVIQVRGRDNCLGPNASSLRLMIHLGFYLIPFIHLFIQKTY